MTTLEEQGSLGRDLHGRVIELINRRDWVALARRIHPSDLSQLKELLLAIVDASQNDTVAKQLFDQFEIGLSRDELASSDGLECGESFLVNYVFAVAEDGSNAPETFHSEYLDSIVENETTIHVIRQTQAFPTVMTFRDHDGEWKVAGWEQLPALAAQVREIQSRLTTGDSSQYLREFLDSELREMRVVGSVGCTPEQVAVLTHLESDLSSTYGVFTIAPEQRAWQLLDDTEQLAEELRAMYEQTAESQKEQVRTFVALSQAAATMEEEDASQDATQ